MSDYKTLLDVWMNPETTGIFAELGKLNVPWKTDAGAESLDLAYYYNHSGQKIISPLVRSQLTDEVVDSAHADKLAHMLYTIYKESWSREWDALVTAKYSPIENVDGYISETTETTGNKTGKSSNTDSGTDNHAYSGTDTMSETGTDNTAHNGSDSETDTGTDVHALTGTDTQKNTGTQENKNVNKDGKSVTDNDIYGYNSSDASNAGKSTTTVNQTITDTRTDNLTQTLEHGQTDTETVNLKKTNEYNSSENETIDKNSSTTYNHSIDETISMTHSGSDSEDTTGSEKHELHRHGNIGVTTNQQMITEELELRKTSFFDLVMRDLDKYLVLNVY